MQKIIDPRHRAGHVTSIKLIWVHMTKIETYGANEFPLNTVENYYYYYFI